MPKKLTQQDLINWRELAAHWGVTDEELWKFIDEGKVPLYKKGKSSFQRAPNSVTLAEVGDLWIPRRYAARFEHWCWARPQVEKARQREKVRIAARSLSPSGGSTGGRRLDLRLVLDSLGILPIKLPDTFDQLLKLPAPDPSKIVLTRSQSPVADDQTAAQPKKPRKPSPTAPHRGKFRDEAKKRWKRSRASTAEMILRLQRHFADEIGYTPHKGTVRRWIADLSPRYTPRTPGRKPSKKE